MSEDELTASVAYDVRLGQGVRLAKFINLYGCRIGDDSRIGAFVEIQKNAVVGCRCKISSHSFLCEGVRIEDEVFIGHGVTFINDKMPRATNSDGTPKSQNDWVLMPTIVRRGAAIGSGATILGNVVIGAYSLIGAGSVVTKDVPDLAIVAGNPAKVLRYLDKNEYVSKVSDTKP
jgi:acetyltransferase-like isoleucine patch superfamily enzyme